MEKKSPNKAASNQDPSADGSNQPRMSTGTLPPQAAQAPEFVPGKPFRASVASQHTDSQKGDQKTSETGSDKMAPQKRKKTKKLTKAEEEAEEKAQKEQAMDEEWWSGDEIFVPNLQDKNDLLNDEQD